MNRPLNEDGPVTLSCIICGDPCVKSEVEDAWVHVEDTIKLGNLQTKYNHEATFDIIEGRVIDE